MKQIMFYAKRLFSKRIVAGLATVLLVAGITGSTLATFGPSRPTMQWVSGGPGFDHVTFNSFTGVPNGIGDERDFFRGTVYQRDSAWADPVLNAPQDGEIEAHIYIHNNAGTNLNTVPDGNGGFVGVAKDVKVSVTLPTGSNQTQDVTSYIRSSNASPQAIFDTLTIKGANNGYFELATVANSAKIKMQKNSQLVDMSDAQEQALFTEAGVNTGDQNGCEDFVREITFRMKVKMPNYTITKQVALPGESNWRETVNVNPGATVSWLITFNNAGRTRLNQVMVVDEVPAGLTVVPGSVKLQNGNYPYTCTGGVVNADCDRRHVFSAAAVQANGRQINVNIGDYNPDSGPAYVSFRTTVADAANLTCGLNTFTNKAFSTPQGYGAIWDTAVATATRTCVPTPPPTTPTPTPTPGTPTTLPSTGPGEVVGLFGATTMLGAFAHRLRTRRS